MKYLVLLLFLLLVSCGKDKNSNPIDPLNKPHITNLVSNHFCIGDEITIIGTKLGIFENLNFVSFNNLIAINCTSWSDTLVNVLVPTGTSSGKVSITVNGIKSNEVDFTIISIDPNIIETILIPSGTFMMGNSGNYRDSWTDDDYPVHKVTLSKPFYIGKFEVTNAQWKALMGTEKSEFNGQNLPVEKVTWYDCIEFCNKLSEKHGLTKCYKKNGKDVQCDWLANGWRLPTEAEWEYACKAGTTTDFYSGNLTNDKCTPLDINLDMIGFYCGNSNSSPKPVGKKAPNAYGIYDMSGNVLEWCWDFWGDYPYTEIIDPKGSSKSSARVLRGGSCNYYANGCRSSYREKYNYMNESGSSVGFRICRNY